MYFRSIFCYFITVSKDVPRFFRDTSRNNRTKNLFLFDKKVLTSSSTNLPNTMLEIHIQYRTRNKNCHFIHEFAKVRSFNQFLLQNSALLILFPSRIIVDSASKYDSWQLRVLPFDFFIHRKKTRRRTTTKVRLSACMHTRREEKMSVTFSSPLDGIFVFLHSSHSR